MSGSSHFLRRRKLHRYSRQPIATLLRSTGGTQARWGPARVVGPSRLFGISRGGKPVLAVARGSCDAARIVQRQGCGLTADPDDPAAVAHAMREMARNPSVISKMSGRARAIAPDYDKLTHLGRFVQTIEEAAAR